MTTVETTRPKVLRKLVIDEFSFVDAPASVGSDVLVWKRHDGGAAGSGSAVDEYLAKVEKALRADPTLDRRGASELVMRDPDLVRRYGEDMPGWSGRPAVAKAAGPDNRAAIRKAVADDDGAELDRLVKLDGGVQYYELLRAGGLDEAAEQGVAKRARTSAQVPAAEVARWRERIRSLLKGKDQKALDAARREGGAAFQAAWIAMFVAGEKLTF